MNNQIGASRETKFNIVMQELDKEIEGVRSKMETLSGRLEKVMNPNTSQAACEKAPQQILPEALEGIRKLTDKIITVNVHLNEIISRLEI
jgi:hypothetical protein